MTSSGLETGAILQCPVAHTHSRQQTVQAENDSSTRLPLERDAGGVWHVRGYREAQEILRSPCTVQAGFNAAQIARIMVPAVSPIIYKDGPAHLTARRQVARLFTPAAVRSRYRGLMERHARDLSEKLRRDKRAELSELSLEMAVRVVGEILGLTNSRTAGMPRRLDGFFREDLGTFELGFAMLARLIRVQWRLLIFYTLDVHPSIRARRRPGSQADDLIAHMIKQGASNTAIFTELLTYAAAGMITTREYLSIAFWHLHQDPVLRARFLAADESAQHAILHEIVRAEPVVAALHRRATSDIPIVSADTKYLIRAGELITVHVDSACTDPRVAGMDPTGVCPDRELADHRLSEALLAFGDGSHKCPGATIAIQETAVLLDHLFRLPVRVLESRPDISRDSFTAGYQIRGLTLVLDQTDALPGN